MEQDDDIDWDFDPPDENNNVIDPNSWRLRVYRRRFGRRRQIPDAEREENRRRTEVLMREIEEDYRRSMRVLSRYLTDLHDRHQRRTPPPPRNTGDWNLAQMQRDLHERLREIEIENSRNLQNTVTEATNAVSDENQTDVENEIREVRPPIQEVLEGFWQRHRYSTVAFGVAVVAWSVYNHVFGILNLLI